MTITKYVWVSQGIKIGETFSKEEAYAYMTSANDDWQKYCQECADNYERAADNEIFVYEEEIDISEIKHEIKAEWKWNEEDECYNCSNCAYSALNDYKGNSSDSTFCPHCGAYMTNSCRVRNS